MLWNSSPFYILKEITVELSSVHSLTEFLNFAAKRNQPLLHRYLDDATARFCLRFRHKSYPLARPSCHIIPTHLLDLVSLPASELGLFTPSLSVKLPR